MRDRHILRRYITPGWIWNHIPGGEQRPESSGARLKRAGFQPGWPDFVLLAPGGKLHCLELKRRGGRMSEHQAAFALWCKLNDVPHEVVDNVPAATKLLKEWGALRRNVTVW